MNIRKLSLLLYSLWILSAQGQEAVTLTRFGKVRGYAEGDVFIFKGIPFAAPPIGDLRWQPPQPPIPWEGVKNCTTFSASPMQPTPVPFLMWTEEFIAPPAPLSEDCLYLNVWTSSLSPAARRPVFVWIYGGGFSSGSAACEIYNGAAYAKEGVVFVSINYRVGVFGFMAHPTLSSSSAEGVSGNYGLLDQIAALRWVRDNIAAFGGDPSNVTIAGQSAGSMSVNSLVASPLAKGLFQKAIAQSGGILSGRFTSGLEQGEKIGLLFQKQAGAASMEELRKIDADSLIRISNKLGGMRFGPLLDGVVLPKDLVKAFAGGDFNDVPFIGGWVTGDGALFPSSIKTPAQFEAYIRERYTAAYDSLLALLPHGDSAQVKASGDLLNLLSFAVVGMHRWSIYSKHPAYLYEFSHVPPNKPGFPNYGAFHTAEVPYALHNLDRWNRSWQPLDRHIEKQMSAYWLQFMRAGDPNKEGLQVWKPYRPLEGQLLELGDRIQPLNGKYVRLLQLIRDL